MTPELFVALSHLDPIDREVFIDVTLLGRTHMQVADSLGVTKLRVQTRLDRALRVLRDQMGAPQVIPVITSHGRTGYKRGCRCQVCRDHNAEGKRRQRENKRLAA